MFYKVELKDHIRVPPDLFNLELEAAIVKRVRYKYDGFISKDFGIVVGVGEVKNVGEGVIIPGDGASYYETTFTLFTFKPEMQEVLWGKIQDIADFGAFMNMGPIDGMVHVSQSMDDYVSFSKEKVLTGKDSKRSLKVNDICKGRVIAVSFKDPLNPKIGITMRQVGLGKPEWIQEDSSKATDKKEAKEDKKEDKKKEKGKESK